MAPAHTPAPIVNSLHKVIVDYIASPDGQKKLADMGLTPGEPDSPAELAKLVAKEVVAWGDVVKKAGAAGIE
jgi:tripartite-type tricarboxylate transporter receptor subunit TctC